MLSSILTSLRIQKHIYTGYSPPNFYRFTVHFPVYFHFLYVSLFLLLQVGRSGRFGHLGLAVNLITYEDRFNLYDINLDFLVLVYCAMFSLVFHLPSSLIFQV